MKMHKKLTLLRGAAVLAVGLIVLVFLVRGLSAISDTSGALGLSMAQQALERSVMQCYAIEGSYPSDVAYLKEHYALTINEELYLIHYRPVGTNLLPEMRVLPRE
jgi:hypothetical protein